MGLILTRVKKICACNCFGKAQKQKPLPETEDYEKLKNISKG